MPDASVVIATHDRAAQLDRCLIALEGQAEAQRFEVVVVDNGSSDATGEVLARHASQRLRSVFVAGPNRAKARNAGIAQARGAIVIFCDDDTIAPERFVTEHLRAHAASPRPAVVSGPIVNVPGPDASIAPSARHWSRAFLCTCNASVAKEQLDAVGGFDERYDLYGWEDTDLGIRLRARGLARVFDWGAYIYHVKPPAAAALERRLTLAAEKGAMAARFVRKTPSWPVRLATGAHPANFVRAALAHAPLMRSLYGRLARRAAPGSLVATLAGEALADAAYVDALKAGLRARGG